MKKNGESPKAVVTVEVTEAGLRRFPQGRELRDPPAVADRRVLRGLPAGHVGGAAPGRRHRARRADRLDDPAGPDQRHHAPPLPRALPADRHRARHRPRGAPGRPPGGAAPRAPGPSRDLEGAADPRRPEPGHQELHLELGHGHQRSSRRTSATSCAGWARPATTARDLGHAPPGAARAVPALPRRSSTSSSPRWPARRRSRTSRPRCCARPPARRARPRTPSSPGSARSRRPPPGVPLARRGRRSSATKAFNDGKQERGRAAQRSPPDAPALAQAAAPVPPDDRRPQPRDRAGPAREGQRAARAGPDRHHGRGQGFTGMEAIWNYFYWQTLAINPLDDSRPHAARVAHPRAALRELRRRAAGQDDRRTRTTVRASATRGSARTSRASSRPTRLDDGSTGDREAPRRRRQEAIDAASSVARGQPEARPAARPARPLEAADRAPARRPGPARDLSCPKRAARSSTGRPAEQPRRAGRRSSARPTSRSARAHRRPEHRPSSSTTCSRHETTPRNSNSLGSAARSWSARSRC